MIIDVHAHLTFPPAALTAFRANQIMFANRPEPFNGASVTDEELAAGLERMQLKEIDAHHVDRAIISPQAIAMGHQYGDEAISRHWTTACNDLVYRAAKLFPTKFIPACQLPQSPGVEPKRWLDELEFRVKEQGFVGCNVNPDISGGAEPLTPSVASEWWYPLYEKVQQLDVPMFFHASATRHPAFHTSGSHYTTWDHTSAFDLAWSADRIFKDFPKLKIVITHGGGAFILQYNRMRAIFQIAKRDYEAAVKHLYWDTAVYEPSTIKTMVDVIGVDNILFSTEMCGAVNAVDPKTGRKFDDTLPMVKALDLSTENERKIVEGNARRLYTRAKFD